mmetsp:Transcript_12256/g.13964  ORF Transcript_12256/g.13964 Transcript_12256/m.13964 type:complete len:129 (+) Transcript_12256:419-805(+)
MLICLAVISIAVGYPLLRFEGYRNFRKTPLANSTVPQGTLPPPPVPHHILIGHPRFSEWIRQSFWSIFAKDSGFQPGDQRTRRGERIDQRTTKESKVEPTISAAMGNQSSSESPVLCTDTTRRGERRG